MKFTTLMFPLLTLAILMFKPPQTSLASTLSEIETIARKNTVLIKVSDPLEPDKFIQAGTGVIIATEPDLKILTVNHILKGKEYRVQMPDGFEETIPSENILRNVQTELQNLDLSLLLSENKRDYSTITFGDSDDMKTSEPVYVCGFPFSNTNDEFDQPLFKCSSGKFSRNGRLFENNGYGLAYDVETLNGMSGGPVINAKGLLIGIHGRYSQAGTRTFYRTGISINAFLTAVTNVSDEAIFSNVKYIKICNEEEPKSLIEFTFAKKTGNGWLTRGWFQIEPNKCKTIAIGANYPEDKIYFYAKPVKGKGYWGGGPKSFCVNINEGFLINNSDTDDCNQKNYKKVPMTEWKIDYGINVIRLKP